MVVWYLFIWHVSWPVRQYLGCIRSVCLQCVLVYQCRTLNIILYMQLFFSVFLLSKRAATKILYFFLMVSTKVWPANWVTIPTTPHHAWRSCSFLVTHHTNWLLIALLDPVDKMAPSPKNEFSRTDLSTLSNYAAAKSTNIDLKWHIDFDQQVIRGSVTHSVEVILPDTRQVKFDSSKLHISSVSINGSPTTYERAETSPSLGTCLAVQIPASLQKPGSQFDVTFHYSTDKDASAVQWLDSKATSSGNHPFVFTQVGSFPKY